MPILIVAILKPHFPVFQTRPHRLSLRVLSVDISPGSSGPIARAADRVDRPARLPVAGAGQGREEGYGRFAGEVLHVLFIFEGGLQTKGLFHNVLITATCVWDKVMLSRWFREP